MRQELCTKCYSSNVLQFNFCWHCGTPPYRGPPVPRDPRVPPVQIDLAKLRARRDAVLAGMAEQPGQQRKCKVADDLDAFLRAYSAGLRGWESWTDHDVFAWCCYLDSHGKGTTWVHDVSCSNVGSNTADDCPAATNCAQRYAPNSLDKGKVSKLKMAYREQLGRGEDWDPVGKLGNPCSSQLVDAYLSYVSVEQKRVGVPVNQANPMLAHVLAELLEDMRSQAQLVESLAQRITITRDIALYSLAFASMRRGHDLSFTKGSQVLRLPQSRGLIFNFQFGKTLRKSREAVVVLADNECPQICAFRGVTEHISAAYSVGWDLAKGHSFPVVLPGGGLGDVALTAPRMVTALQGHLRAAGLPTKFTMHSFRSGGSLSKSLAGTPMDEIMHMGGWKTESMARYYIGPTTSTRVGGAKRQRDQACADASDLPLSPAFAEDFAACSPKFHFK